jgi:hypothetical protein
MQILRTTTDVFSLFLRVLFFLGLILFPLALGGLGRGILTALLTVPIFVLADYYGSRRARPQAMPLAAFIGHSLVVQIYLVGVLYVSGLLLGWAQQVPVQPEFSRMDFALLLAFLAYVIVTGHALRGLVLPRHRDQQQERALARRKA